VGNVYISDTNNNRIRKLNTIEFGTITTVAGNGTGMFSGDGGPATSAELNEPKGIASDAIGNLYIADALNNRVRRVDAVTGVITTVAGNGTSGFSGDGSTATSAELDDPWAVAIDAEGNLFIADTGNNRVRKVDTNGIITTVAGNGSVASATQPNGDGGRATQATVSQPLGVAVDAAGDIYISSGDSYRIRRVDTNGTIVTVAGLDSRISTGDGGPATEANFSPLGIATDSTGNIYIADYLNSRVRKVDVSQSFHNFLYQSINSASSSSRFVITNIGNQHLQLDDLNLTNDFQPVSGDPSDCSFSSNLGSGFSCAVRISFMPTQPVPVAGFASITDNSLNQTNAVQQIQLLGIGVTP
jgi:hypothetical protein